MDGFLPRVVPAISALICLATVLIAMRRRDRTPAAGPLALTAMVALVWSVAATFRTVMPDARARLALDLVAVACGGPLVPAFLWFAQSIADPNAVLSRRAARWLLIQPGLATLETLTDPWHHLVFSSSRLIGNPPASVHTLGALLWVNTGYCYVISSWALFVLLTAWRQGSPLHRRQISFVLAGVVLPLAANGLVLLRGRWGGSFDLVPPAFAVSLAIYAWAMLREGMLAVVPLARGQVMDRIGDAVVVLDPQGVVIDTNRASERILRSLRPPDVTGLVGLRWAELLPGAAAPQSGAGRREFSVEVDGGRRVDLDVTRDDLLDGRGRRLGAVLVARDVTELNDHRRRVEANNNRLEDQLATINRLQSDLAEQAVRDELTGLHNRRYLWAAMDRAIRQAADSGAALSVVLLDIDHFKRINDTWGHPVGDEVLKAVARTLSEHTRDTDVVARYGGEEFVLVFPGAPAAEAMDRTERLRRHCERVAVPIDSGVVSLTVSAGVAEHQPLGGSAAELLKAADAALYRAKAGGRNRVLLAVS